VYYWEGEPLFLETKQLTCQEKQLKVDNGADLQEVQLFKTWKQHLLLILSILKKDKKL
jgi:hypothetical protein